MAGNFEIELDDLLFRFGYYLNADDAYYHAPDDEDGEDPMKLLEAVRDALERF